MGKAGFSRAGIFCRPLGGLLQSLVSWEESPFWGARQSCGRFAPNARHRPGAERDLVDPRIPCWTWQLEPGPHSQPQRQARRQIIERTLLTQLERRRSWGNSREKVFGVQQCGRGRPSQRPSARANKEDRPKFRFRRDSCKTADKHAGRKSWTERRRASTRPGFPILPPDPASKPNGRGH